MRQVRVALASTAAVGAVEAVTIIAHHGIDTTAAMAVVRAVACGSSTHIKAKAVPRAPVRQTHQSPQEAEEEARVVQMHPRLSSMHHHL